MFAFVAVGVGKAVLVFTMDKNYITQLQVSVFLRLINKTELALWSKGRVDGSHSEDRGSIPMRAKSFLPKSSMDVAG